MNKMPLSIQLEQIMIQNAELFYFIMPEETIGVKNVEIFVEYGVDQKSRKSVVFKIWSRPSGCPIRKFVCGSEIQLENKFGSPVDQILFLINMNPDIHEYIRQNNVWFERNRHILEAK